jgi:hypothetical protein
LKLVVQVKGELGRLVTLAKVTTDRTTTVLRVGRWDRIVARFLTGHDELPAVVATRVVHSRHSSVHRRAVR